MKLRSSAVSAILVIGGLPIAHAQEADVVAYPAERYADIAPQTALDMVRRTPGFTLLEGNEDVRGFGATAGNVLIDGVRPTAKAGVIDALSRIPASQVVRIEVIRNAATAEAQGQTLVANVVRARTATSGAWSFELERNANGVIYPRAEATYSSTFGGWETSVRANAFWEEFPFRTLRLNRDPQGVLVSTTEVDLPSTLSEAYIGGDARTSLAGGVLTLNARLGRYSYTYDQPGQTYLGRLPDGSPDQTQLTSFDEEKWIVEMGADYARQFGDWTWKTLGVLNLESGEENQSDARFLPSGSLVSRTVADGTGRPLEIVGRTTLSGPLSGQLRLEAGGELAFNRLDSDFALAVDNGSGLTPVVLPSASVTVEELRAEAFRNLVWTLSEQWTVEGGLEVETSEISVDGDAADAQRFTFTKPSLALVWRPTPSLQVRLGAKHSVGQLDFSDFAASAQLDDGTSSAGNPDLGPDQTTRYSAAVDFRGPGDLAFNVELFHEDRADVLEQVLLPSGAPGVANAGDATYRGLKASLTLPLDTVLAGARLKVNGETVETRFDDPLTGVRRPLSNVWTPDVSVEFRHDPPGVSFAWGLTWEAAESGETYLVNEINRENEQAEFGGFIETTAFAGLKTRLALRNADVYRSVRLRSFFSPDRSGELVRTEERRIRSPTFVTLTVSGGF